MNQSQKEQFDYSNNEDVLKAATKLAGKNY